MLRSGLGRLAQCIYKLPLMDDLSSILFDSTRRLLSDLAEEFPPGHALSAEDKASAWRRVEEMGLPFAMVPDDMGGFGLQQADAFELVRICGSEIVPLPLVQTILAHRFAAEAGKEPDGQMTERLGDLSDDQLAVAALARAVQMTGALETILGMTVRHVQERQQFGRPLSNFQAVQHLLAVLAGEVAASRAASDHAVACFDRTDCTCNIAVAVARARIGEAASKGSSIAHQLHGAIGFAQEHKLQVYTRALWKWRDDFGTQAYWTRKVGEQVLAPGADDLWNMVTAA